MYKNYLKIAIRNLARHKSFSIINIVGLALGIAISLIIYLWILDELSYDRFHKDSDRIYRLSVDGFFGNEPFNTVNTAAPTAKTFLRELDQIEEATRVLKGWDKQVSYKEKIFSENFFMYADSNFFEFFSFELLKGDPHNVLDDSCSVVITETTAKRYFGNENPIGKALSSDEGRDYMVTGVCADVPANSHFKFDFIASLNTFNWVLDDSYGWISLSFATYLKLTSNADTAALSQSMNKIALQHIAPQLEEFLGVAIDDFASSGQRYRIAMHPITDIHLHSHLDGEFEINGDYDDVIVFSIIAIFILFIACINFMNLTTARSAARMKEIGIRKALGSSRRYLVIQFLTESLLMTSMALVLSFAIIENLLPYFNELAGKELEFRPFTKWQHIPAFILLVTGIGFLSGSYPAYFLSSFNPTMILANKVRRKVKVSFLRSGLVLFQFAISITLIICTINIYRQLSYVQQKDIGINKNHILVLEHAYSLGNRKEKFKEQVKMHRYIRNATISFTLPGDLFNSSSHQAEGRPDDELHVCQQLPVDYDFASTMDVRLKRGRFFSRSVASDSMAVVINEAAAREMGFEQAIGKTVQRSSLETTGQQFKVIGVVEDFNFESLHREVRPLVINLIDENQYAKFIAINIDLRHKKECVKHIEKVWRELVPGQTFQYFFLGSHLERLYKEDQQTAQLFYVFSILAIFIALLGLYGLSTFITSQRTKEIGIRKVLGASEVSIVLMLWKDFSRWVLMANAIAWPLAYLFLRHWLNNFAFSSSISWFSFPLVALGILIIAMLTISVQSVQAALSSPAKAIKYE